MGQLNDARIKIEKIIEAKKLDPIKTKGQIGLKAGLMLAFVNAGTPDDSAKLEKLKLAVKEVLNETI